MQIFVVEKIGGGLPTTKVVDCFVIRRWLIPRNGTHPAHRGVFSTISSDEISYFRIAIIAMKFSICYARARRVRTAAACLLVALVFASSVGFAPPDEVSFLRSFGGFSRPHAAAFDNSGNLYVVDSGNDRVIKFSAQGDSLACVSGSGFGDTQFESPDGIAVTGTDVYVADYGNHRIQRFNRNLDYMATLYTRDDPNDDKRFGYPKGVAVSSQGDLFVLDGENIRIMKVNAFNVIQQNFGSLDAGAERLISPAQITIDANDVLYVLDDGVIKMFDIYGNPSGTLAKFFPAPARAISGSGDALFILSDSAMTGVSARLAEQSPYEIHLPDTRAQWFALAVSKNSIALLDEHTAYLYSR